MTLKLKHTYKGVLAILLFFVTTITVFGQDNAYIKFDESYSAAPDSCLTNLSDYSKLKLYRKPVKTTLTNFSIETKVDRNTKTFRSIEEFNAFDFKFWILSISGFKQNKTLDIEIKYNVNTVRITQNYNFCLLYIEAEVTNDRGTESKPDFVTLPVYFGTDRNYAKTNDLNEAFGIERAKLKYGIVDVSIPHDHRVGEIESPSIWKFEFSEDPSKHIMLQKVNLLDRAQFFSKLSSDIQKSERKSTFLFVHGYNTSFSEAAKRTAQISYDLKFDGKAVFYSWPSQASTFRYGKDEKNIEWSQKNIQHFLKDYLSKSKAEDIYLVAHSMGNRGLTKAIVQVMKENPELNKNIKEIILAAPDIDAQVFKNDIAPKMVQGTKKPITLYVNSDDLALKASKLLHGNSRAGDAGEEIVIIDGLETIDATGIDTSFLSHSYFADTNSIIADIFNIIKSGQRAVDRKYLNLQKLKNKIYWKVKQ